MDDEERTARMRALRETVWRNNIFRWAGKIIGELGRIGRMRPVETRC